MLVVRPRSLNSLGDWEACARIQGDVFVLEFAFSRTFKGTKVEDEDGGSDRMGQLYGLEE